MGHRRGQNDIERGTGGPPARRLDMTWASMAATVLLLGVGVAVFAAMQIASGERRQERYNVPFNATKTSW
jgi:hypothetical protein